jgi:putative nucleotidyltransferase with HDIG domain
VDAKDQVTHGHIRRVQQFALRLARVLDIRDESTLRAIEAAGLLHDIGKLAIPDHILNKPGKLTATEFDRMKLHAEAGAQILSAIDFPFPVVPIVRHHHENWDGRGYPSGLSGDQIPIGARILAVVDCFDALTSDRPYRRALSAESALNVLTERRGTMYDPLVVDTFVQVYRDIANLDVLPAAQPHILVEIARSSCTVPVAETKAHGGITTPENEARESVWCETDDIAERAALALEAFLPVSMFAVYAYAPVRDEVVLVYQKGGAISFAGCRLPLGRTVTGWAAANRTCVVNGDPSLDLGAVNATACERMRSCLAVPLIAGDRLLGVLTLYSDQEQAFDASSRRVAEGFAPYLARWIERAGTNGRRSSSMPGLDSHSRSEASALVVTH